MDSCYFCVEESFVLTIENVYGGTDLKYFLQTIEKRKLESERNRESFWKKISRKSITKFMVDEIRVFI